MTRRRIAIIVQRYGQEVNGGAEDAARAIAEHLTVLGDIHVITTCAVDYTTWADYYPAGNSKMNGVTLHRFPVDQPRNWKQAYKTSGRFWLQEHSLTEQMNWIRENGPFSIPLLQFIRQTEPGFDAFIFVTYLYATTFFGLPMVARKAIFIPTAHDEPLLYGDAYRILFHLPRHIVYLTEAEREIARRVTGNDHIPSTIAAIGINAPDDVSDGRFRQKYGITGDFLLYGGRITPGKNIPELLEFFLRYRSRNPHPLKLVLMGSANFPIPIHPDIISIGFVSEQDKFDALHAATAIIQPSRYESLSIIILEAWLVETPVIVNGQCPVTKQQCRHSNGGLYYSGYQEFSAILTRLLHSPQLCLTLGRQGRRFTTTTYNWDAIINQYQAILTEVVK